MPHTLSKSDYHLARSCPTKLFYRELGYPTSDEGDDYLRLLADGGYIVEKIAKLLHPDGITVESGVNLTDTVVRTRELLARENVTLFEATLLSGAKLSRVDILVKHGMEFHLLEVKAKLWNSDEERQLSSEGKPGALRNRNGSITAKWRKPIEDVAFQVHLLRELYPQATIRASLVMPDKSKTTTIDLIHKLFAVHRVPQPGTSMTRVAVEFTGDAARVASDHFLSFVPVDAEVASVLPEVAAAANEFVASLSPVLVRVPVPAALHCRECEFHASDTDVRDGFVECWGELAHADPHLFDMYCVSEIGGRSDPLADRLIAKGKASLLDIEEAQLVKKDGTPGANNVRQRIQLAHTRDNTPWFSPELGGILGALAYPLHFIDFETSALAVPYHAGMHPYEDVAFQWSCYTIAEPGARAEHAEWINTEDFFPNFEFVQTLRTHIGDGGTVLMWAAHERKILNVIRAQIGIRAHDDAALVAWINSLTDKEHGRLVDMNRLTFLHYFHPLMKGRTSIKSVLDAVWRSDEMVHALFPRYAAGGDSPYQALPPLEIGGVDVHVAEGTGAVKAYQSMLYGADRDDAEIKAKWRDLLRQYCQLDTAAMVMIFDHWKRIT
ncbi:MAG: DUF2779 domain-containing protein [Gemmatimonadota bacterium]|nr:DUF2779 domain-containing protein [Gemmatimonadota bacterium]